MKNKVILATILTLVGAALIAAATFFGNKNDKDDEPQKQTASLDFATIEKDIEASAKLYDVRTAVEYAESHIDGAINFSSQLLESDQFPEIAKDTKIYVYCRSGSRSSLSKKLLENAGFSNVTDLGGISKVQSIGGQLSTEN